jgi:hypothetical protein
MNQIEQEVEIIVTRSANRVHIVNTCETVDQNIERIIGKDGGVDGYTLVGDVEGVRYDARDTLEIMELARTYPDICKLKIYKYTPEEIQIRQDPSRKQAQAKA